MCARESERAEILETGMYSHVLQKAQKVEKWRRSVVRANRERGDTIAQLLRSYYVILTGDLGNRRWQAQLFSVELDSAGQAGRSLPRSVSVAHHYYSVCTARHIDIISSSYTLILE
jgi:hypothetical protein